MEPKAELVMITVSMMNGGEFSLESPGSVALMYTYPKQTGKAGQVATLQLIINYHQLMARRTPDMGVKPVGTPSCTLQAALKQILTIKPFSNKNNISTIYI